MKKKPLGFKGFLFFFICAQPDKTQCWAYLGKPCLKRGEISTLFLIF